MKRISFVFFLIAALIGCGCCYPFGKDVHNLVSRLAVENLPPEVQKFYRGKMRQLYKESNMPDKLLKKSPERGFEHYVNIEKLDLVYLRRLKNLHDVYMLTNPMPKKEHYLDFIDSIDSDFFSKVQFPYSPDKVELLLQQLPPHPGMIFKTYRHYEIKQIGMGNYQVLMHFAALIRAFKSGTPKEIITATGYLSHFLTDLHQPLHNTVNYKGQYTGNRTFKKGINRNIHSRYETGIPAKYIRDITANVTKKLRDPKDLRGEDIMALSIDITRRSYPLTGKIIASDNNYFEQNPQKRIKWQDYYSYMHEQTGDDLVGQLSSAANLLGDLIFTAYLAAYPPREPQEANPDKGTVEQ